MLADLTDGYPSLDPVRHPAARDEPPAPTRVSWKVPGTGWRLSSRLLAGIQAN